MRKILQTHPVEVHHALTEWIRKEPVPLTDKRGIYRGNGSMVLSQRAKNLL